MKARMLILCFIGFVSCTTNGTPNTEQQKVLEEVIIQSDKLVGKWSLEQVMGYDQSTYQVDQYELIKKNFDDKFSYYAGNFIELDSVGNYISYYRAPCGNDCFPSTYGKYQFVEDDKHIKLTLDSIKVFGFCPNREEVVDEELGTYLIDSISNGYQLIRTQEGLSDDQVRAFSRIVNAIPRITTGGSGLNWVQLDPLNRDKDNAKILAKGLKATGKYDSEKAELVFFKNISRGYYKILVFRYEDKTQVAIYSAGPEVFAVWNKTIPE